MLAYAPTQPGVLSLVGTSAGKQHAGIRQRRHENADFCATSINRVKQTHFGARPVGLHGVCWSVRNACAKTCGIDVFGNKLAESLVAVVTLTWVSWWVV